MQYWYHKTDIGTFYIIQDKNEYDILFEGKILGTYDNPQQAVEALIGGHTALSSLYASSSLGIPEDIKNWEKGLSRI